MNLKMLLEAEYHAVVVPVRPTPPLLTPDEADSDPALAAERQALLAAAQADAEAEAEAQARRDAIAEQYRDAGLGEIVDD